MAAPESRDPGKVDLHKDSFSASAETKPRPYNHHLNKACESCRSLKVRCLPGSGGICQRCIKYDRQCIYAQQVRKKPRKRTDARVAQLEKEITAMRSLLSAKAGHGALSPPSSKESPDAVSLDSPGPEIAQSPAAIRDAVPNIGAPQIGLASSSSAQSRGDIISRGLLSHAEAARLLDIFRSIHTPHFPLYIARPSATVDHLRKTQPLTFHAIMTAASGVGNPALQSALNAEIIQEFAQKVMISGEKSLDLVQALNINAAWYLPVDRFSALKYYEYSHTSATIAINAGLGDRDIADDIKDPIERKQTQLTLLGCYVQCAALSMMRRQPNFLRFSTYMSDIIKDLEDSDATTSDEQILCALARLVNIGEEVQSVLALCDHGRQGDVPESKQQQDIVNFTRKLRIWSSLYRPDTRCVDLIFMQHCLTLILHESILHKLYPPGFFRPPFTLAAPKPNVSLTQTDQRSLTLACSAARAMLDLSLAQDLQWLRSAPGHLPARMVYAIVLLIGITFIPADDLSILDRDTHLDMQKEITQLDKYLDAIIDRMLQAAGFMEYRAPTVFVGPLIYCKKWLKWATDLYHRGEPLDGGLKYSLFGGPEDHPAFVITQRSDSGDSTAQSESEQELRPFTAGMSASPRPRIVQSLPAGGTDSITGQTADQTQSRSGTLPSQQSPSTMISLNHGMIDVEWGDLSDMPDMPALLDASVFASDFDFGLMSNAFENFGTPSYTGELLGDFGTNDTSILGGRNGTEDELLASDSGAELAQAGVTPGISTNDEFFSLAMADRKRS